MADKGGKKQFMFHGLRLTNSRLPTISFEFGFDDKPLLEIIAKCCVLIREWCGLYHALLDVSMNNIALFVIVDDCTAKRAIIASNGFKGILGNFLKIYVERPSPFSATANPGSVTNVDQANVMSMFNVIGNFQQVVAVCLVCALVSRSVTILRHKVNLTKLLMSTLDYFMWICNVTLSG